MNPRTLRLPGSRLDRTRLLHFFFVEGFGAEFTFHTRDCQSGRRVADHVDGRTDHVKDTVHAGNQSNDFQRDANLREDQSRHDQASARNTGGTDSGENTRQNHNHLIR